MSEFETLCHCDGVIIAQRVRAMLEDEGIPVRIDGEQSNAMFGGMAFVDLRIMVPRDRLDEAKRLIDEFEESEESEHEQPATAHPHQTADVHGEQDEPDEEKMPPRLSRRQQRMARRFTWPILTLGGLAAAASGNWMEAGFAFVFAVMSWGLLGGGADERPDAQLPDAGGDPEDLPPVD